MNRDDLDFGDRVLTRDFKEMAPLTDIPIQTETMADGSEVLRYGDVEEYCRDWHPAGENVYGYRNTGSLVLCEQLLRRSGIEVTEDALVEHAAERGHIYVNDQPATSGAMTLHGLCETMSDLHAPARLERGQSLEDAAMSFEHGYGVLLELSDWELAETEGADIGSRRLALLTGLQRDANNGSLLGFYLNDSAGPEPGTFISADRLERAWFAASGAYLVTDIPLQPD